MKPTTPSPDSRPTKVQIPEPVFNAGVQESVVSNIHPVVWMSIGVGVFAGVFLFASLFGFLDSGAIERKEVATKPIRKEDNPWWRELGGTAVEGSSEVSSGAVAPLSTAEKPAAKRTGQILWDDEQEAYSSLSSIARDAVPRNATLVQDPRVAPDASPNALSAEDLYDRIAPSVVTIHVKDESGVHITTGSGFIVDSDAFNGHYLGLTTDRSWADLVSANGTHVEMAYVLTNYHVIRPAVAADIMFFGGGSGKVESVVAESADADLALLSVLAPANPPAAGIPFAIREPRVGAKVFAIGSPQGFSSTLSEGIVSGFRDLSKSGLWLQTTAPISPGSSGGPLILADGHVVGVMTLTREGAQNVNFAVPISRFTLVAVSVAPCLARC